MDPKQELLKRIVRESVVLADEPELDVVEVQLPRDLFLELIRQVKASGRHES